MKAAELLPEVQRALLTDGLDEVELFVKAGRSRRVQLSPEGPTTVASRERGWAVRAGDRRSSFFAAGSGEASPAGPWPAADGRALRLPDAVPVPAWSPAADLDEPLLAEAEALSFLAALAESLGGELPRARLTGSFLEQGASQSSIASSRGVAGEYRSRAAALWVEAALPATGERAALHLAARSARAFSPTALGRRLADRLALVRDGRPVTRDRGELLLAPPVAVRLLAGMLPALLGPAGATRAAEMADRQGRIAARRVSVIDDGRLPGGVFAAPFDGEGMPTRETVLVDEGVFRQPLVSWDEARAPSHRAAGCCRRPSWRDLPRPGPTHLFVRPRRGVAVGDLLGSIARGYYFLDLTGSPRFDLAADRFSLPVCGFALRAGRAAEPVTGVWLHGSLSTVWQRVQEVARDLTFFPLGGMLGAPSMLVTGLEISPQPPLPTPA